MKTYQLKLFPERKKERVFPRELERVFMGRARDSYRPENRLYQYKEKKT